MNEALALRTIHRPLETVCREIYERRENLWQMRNLLAQCMDYDQPTILVDGDEVHVLHSVELPRDLVEFVREEAAAIYSLEREVALRREAGESIG